MDCIQRNRIVSLALLTVLAGCGQDRFPVAPVSGTITLDGQPLAGARIGFEPIAPPGEMNSGPGAYGKTDATGVFSVATIERQRGAVIGPNRVTITTFTEDENGQVIRGEEVPMKYFDDERLSFTVPEAGTDQADFALTSE